mgnify:CR=1 FL=1
MISFWCHTIKHKTLVLGYILRFCCKLIYRGVVHDYSKLGFFEGSSYGRYLPELKDMNYGSEKYEQVLKKFQPAIDHHYLLNRHHPQHFKEGYSGMNLLDLTEMFFDWKAASRKKIGTGSLEKSLSINVDRFKMSEDISKIMHNSLDI